MRYIQRLNKGKQTMRYIQRDYKQRDIYKGMRYKGCKQIQ